MFDPDDVPRSLPPMARLRNAAVSAAIRSIKSPNCWPRGPIKCGPGSEARPGIARIKLSGGQFEAPNTKLMGPVKWSYFYLYVILDIDRRRVTGWRVEDAESAIQFKALAIVLEPMANHGSIQDAMAKHAVPPDQLTLHADRGGPMKAKATALMLADLGVVKSLGPAAYVERQPVHGGPVQDPEISAGIPKTVPNHRRRPCLLPSLLRLV